MSFRRLVLMALLIGCNGVDDPGDAGMDAGVDAGTPEDAGDPDAGEAPIVEIGTGQDAFEPLTEGQNVMLTQGIQSGGGRMGGYHIWGAVRAKGLATRNALIEIVLYDQDGDQQARQERMLTLEPSGEFDTAYGFAPQIMDCCEVANRTVRMTARVQDTNGVVGNDERMLMAGPCIDIITNQSRCP